MLKIITIACVFTVNGCAVRYKPISPQNVLFSNNTNSAKEIEFSYQYDVLSTSRNYRYAKKETKKGFKVIAVKIKNNTDAPINLRKDVIFKYGDKEVMPLAPEGTGKVIKQKVAIYLLYFLLTVTYTTVQPQSNGYGRVSPQYDTKYIPIGLPIGIGNMIFAYSANEKFREELREYDIRSKTVQPQQTLYGLITIKAETNQPLQLILKK